MINGPTLNSGLKCEQKLYCQCSSSLGLAELYKTGIIQLHYNGMIYQDIDIDVIFIFLMNSVSSDKVVGNLFQARINSIIISLGMLLSYLSFTPGISLT